MPIIEVGSYVDIPLLPTKDMMWAIARSDIIEVCKTAPTDVKTSMLISWDHETAYWDYMALVKHVLDN